MDNKSECLTKMDALWLAYVNSDPDLRALEAEKQALERKHSVMAGAKKMAQMRAQEARVNLFQTVAEFVVLCLTMGAMYAVVCLLSAL
jgi:hypothetical protein